MIYDNLNRLKLKAGNLQPYFKIHMKNNKAISFGTTRSINEVDVMSPSLAFMEAEIKMLAPPEGVKVFVTLSFPNFLLSKNPENEDEIRMITQMGTHWVMSYGYANGSGAYSDAECKVRDIPLVLSSAAFTYENTTRGYEIRLEFVGVMDYVLARIPILYCANLWALLKSSESKTTTIRKMKTSGLSLSTPQPGAMPLPAPVASVEEVTTDIAVGKVSIEKIFNALILDFDLIFSVKDQLISVIPESAPEDSLQRSFIEMFDIFSRDDLLKSVDDLEFYCPDTAQYTAGEIVENLFAGNLAKADYANSILLMGNSENPTKTLDTMSVLTYIEGVLYENAMALYPSPPSSNGFKYTIMILSESGSKMAGSVGSSSRTFRGTRKWVEPYHLLSKGSEIHNFTIDMTSQDTLAAIEFLKVIQTNAGGGETIDIPNEEDTTTGEKVLMSLYDIWKRRAQVVTVTCYSEPKMYIQDIITLMSNNEIIRGDYIVFEVSHKISSSMDIITEFKAAKMFDEKKVAYTPDSNMMDSINALYPESEIVAEPLRSIVVGETFADTRMNSR